MKMQCIGVHDKNIGIYIQCRKNLWEMETMHLMLHLLALCHVKSETSGGEHFPAS